MKNSIFPQEPYHEDRWTRWQRGQPVYTEIEVKSLYRSCVRGQWDKLPSQPHQIERALAPLVAQWGELIPQVMAAIDPCVHQYLMQAVLLDSLTLCLEAT